MLGAIAGDIIGSPFEFYNVKRTDFKLFGMVSRYTDDTVLTIATADCLLNKGDYAQFYKTYARSHPLAGYGGKFMLWAMMGSPKPYNSWGNGSAMRVSPVGYAFDTLEEVLSEASRSAEVTHNHPEGIKGAQAIAASVFLLRTGTGKDQLRQYIADSFGYVLNRTLDDIRPGYGFDVSCMGSVPEAITAFLESIDFEDAVRKAVSLGGDSDTIACMTGALAEAHYGGVPENIEREAMSRLPESFKDVISRFYSAYKVRK